MYLLSFSFALKGKSDLPFIPKTVPCESAKLWYNKYRMHPSSMTRRI